MALYCKIDCALDMNPKIRRAGRAGREVFLFLLRRNRMLDARGVLPPINIDPDYLADQLMMSSDEAVTGVSLCVTARLLRVTDDNVAIIGWSDEWSREPMTGAERQAAHRRKKKETKLLGDSVTESNDANVTRNASNVREEKKREEKRERGAPDEPALAPPRKKRGAKGTHAPTAETPLALELWAEQDRLRQESIPGCRRLKPDGEQLARVEAAIREYGEEDCRHVLAVYAAEAKSNPASAQWFDGVSNWRTDNFNRARGRTVEHVAGAASARAATSRPQFGPVPVDYAAIGTPGVRAL